MGIRHTFLKRMGGGATIGLFLVLAWSGESLAQPGTGVIAGRVTTETAGVAGAVVTARNLATGFRLSAITDSSGAYRIHGLPIGVYDVTVEAAGFATGLIGGMAVAEPGLPNVDVRLMRVTSAVVVHATPSPEAVKPGPRMEIYGFIQEDNIYDFDQVDPDWFDVLRPTKLPAFEDEFGEDGNFWASVRQTRFGVRSWLPTGWGELQAQFEFDLFGVNPDAGQTTFHLLHAWAELGPFLVGQTNSVFMDGELFPLAIDYWGPNGIVAFRNVQVRWMPMRGENELYVALERPGATGDSGRLSDRVELQNIRGHFPVPDLTVHYRRNGDWGHVQLAGLVRYVAWEDTLEDAFDLSGHATGWGLNLSTNIKVAKTGTIRASVTYGEGVENYMNDAPVDIGARTNLGNPSRPVVGEPLPVLGVSAFYDFYWSECFASALGWSMIDIDNSNLQTPLAFHRGQYAITNLLYYPVKNLMAGIEFLWGRRENFGGFTSDDFRMQMSAKYNFSFNLGGGH